MPHGGRWYTSGMRRRLLLAGTALVTILIVVLYLFARPIAISLSRGWLAQLGVSSLAFDEIAPRLTSTEIRGLRITYTTPSVTVSADLPSLRLRYDLWKLIQSNGLPQIQANGGRVSLTFPTSDPSDQAETEPITLPPLSLPFESLSMRSVHIDGLPIPLIISGKVQRGAPHYARLKVAVAGFEIAARITLDEQEGSLASEGHAQANRTPIGDWRVRAALSPARELTLFPESIVRVHEVPAHIGIQLTPFTLTLLEPYTLHLPLGSGTALKVGVSPLRLTHPLLSLESSVNGTIIVQREELQGALRAELELPQLAISTEQYQPPHLAARGTVTLHDQQLALHANAHPLLGTLSLEGSVAMNLATMAGALTVQMPTQPLPEGVSLASLHAVWPFPADMQRGRLGGQARIPFGTPGELITYQVRLEDATVSAGGIALHGVSSHASLKYDTGISTTQPAEVRIVGIDAPFAPQNLRGIVRLLPGNVVVLDDVQGALLGGTILVPRARLDLTANEWTVPVQIEDLSLAQLLEVYPQERVRGSGSLNLQATLLRSPKGFEIHQGRVSAAPPGGVLQYDSGPLSESAEGGLVVALEALKNLHYDTLHADVSLAPSGVLELGVAMRGRNPSWQQGRPVEFNLQLEENVFELVRSIQLARGMGSEVTSTIERALERRQ